MFTLKSAETLPLTPELAQQFQSMPAAPVERGLNPRRVKHLHDRAESGLLTSFNWAKVELPDGSVLRMNGQHSSTMLAELNGSFPNGLYVHIDTYKVDDEDGMAVLFRQFDARESGRSAADVAGAYQCLYPEVADVPRAAAKLAIEGVCYHTRVIEGLPTPSGDDRYVIFNRPALYGFINYVGDTVGMKQPEMKKEQIIAAMYATHCINEIASREFWNIVSRGGDELNPDHPASVLSCWLQQAKSREIEPAPKPMHFYQACIHAWNAFRTGSECKINIKRIMGAKELYEPHG